VTQRVLVAGVGNIFLGDDGFGVEVAKRLAKLDLPDWVAVGDYGISGIHLAYDLADGVQTAILVDAMPRGGEPGTVYVVEPVSDKSEDQDDRPPAMALFDGHGMQPDVVLGLLDTLGAEVGRVLIVGCEPATAEPGMELSAPVAAAVDDAVRIVLELIEAGVADAGKREEPSHVSWHPR
jgi:hydrogenase maturation protease